MDISAHNQYHCNHQITSYQYMCHMLTFLIQEKGQDEYLFHSRDLRKRSYPATDLDLSTSIYSTALGKLVFPMVPQK
eukprot:5776854-Ditylum_brightwellii.AAC.1